MQGKLPASITVTVTSKHIAKGDRLRYNHGVLALAVRDAVAEFSPVYPVSVSENNVLIHTAKFTHGKYYIPDKAWKLAARHRAGKRVKPATFTFEAIYIPRDYR